MKNKRDENIGQWKSFIMSNKNNNPVSAIFKRMSEDNIEAYACIYKNGIKYDEDAYLISGYIGFQCGDGKLNFGEACRKLNYGSTEKIFQSILGKNSLEDAKPNIIYLVKSLINENISLDIFSFTKDLIYFGYESEGTKSFSTKRKWAKSYWCGSESYNKDSKEEK